MSEYYNLTTIEKSLNIDIENLKLIQPIIEHNSQNVKLLKKDIENKYNLLIETANAEKLALLSELKIAEDKNEKFAYLNSSLNRLQSILRTSQCEQERIIDDYKKIKFDYDDFKNSSINIINGTKESNRLIAELSINTINVNDIITLNNKEKNETILSKSQYEKILLDRFIASSNKESIELKINHSPTYMCNYDNLVFVCDCFPKLSVFEISSNKIIPKRENQNIFFINIKAISVNSKSFGVLYSGMSISEIKRYGETLSENGVCLFNRSDFRVSNNYSTSIKKEKNFKNPSAFVLCENYLYVSDYIIDKKISKIYKLDFNGRVLMKHKNEGNIYDISLNLKFLVFSDKINHTLNLFSLDQMEFIKKETIHIPNQFDEGPLNVALLNDNMIFIINRKQGEVLLYNSNLNYRTTFNVQSYYLHNLVVLNTPNNESLIIGYQTKSNEYKLQCFFSNK